MADSSPYLPTPVLFLITQFEYGGAQKIILQLFKRINRTRFEPHLAVLYDKGSHLDGIEKQHGVRVENFRMKQEGIPLFLKPFIFAGGLLRMIRFLKGRKIEILQTFSHFSNILGPVAATLAGTPIRITSQRMSLNYRSKKIQKLDALIENSGCVTRLIAVSQGTANSCVHYQGIRPEKIIVIRNGIDLSEVDRVLETSVRFKVRDRLGCPQESVCIGTLARLHPQKGHSYLIEAAIQLIPKWPGVKFLFFGDGALKAEIEEKTFASGFSGNFQVFPAQKNVIEIYQALDIFVLPSLWEGFPNTVLEAMACHLPIVATEVDGTPELVQNEITGFLVPSKDSHALAGVIEKLLVNPEMRKSFGEQGRKRIEEHFEIQKMIQQYEKVYLDCLKHPRS